MLTLPGGAGVDEIHTAVPRSGSERHTRQRHQGTVELHCKMAPKSDCGLKRGLTLDNIKRFLKKPSKDT